MNTEVRFALRERDPPAEVLDALATWERDSRAAAVAAAANVGRARTLQHRVRAKVWCPRRRSPHLLARVYQVPEGPLLWPTAARPWTGDDVQRGTPEPRDPAPIVLPVGRRRPFLSDGRVQLLTAPEALREWTALPVDLWCRCGHHSVDILDLSGRLRTASDTLMITAQRP